MGSRWVILRHTFSKDSLDGLHYDLLIEDIEDCRTWRLPSIPLLNGPLIKAQLISPHKLDWLEKEACVVSGDRGWAKCIFRGTYSGFLPFHRSEMLSIEIKSTNLSGTLQILNGLCKITSNSKFDFI